MVWACIKIIRACQGDFTRSSARREKKGPTNEALGKQHRRMDRVEVLPCRKRSWKQNKMEGEGCNRLWRPNGHWLRDRCMCIKPSNTLPRRSSNNLLLKVVCYVQWSDLCVHLDKILKNGFIIKLSLKQVRSVNRRTLRWSLKVVFSFDDEVNIHCLISHLPFLYLVNGTVTIYLSRLCFA